MIVGVVEDADVGEVLGIRGSIEEVEVMALMEVGL